VGEAHVERRVRRRAGRPRLELLVLHLRDDGGRGNLGASFRRRGQGDGQPLHRLLRARHVPRLLQPGARHRRQRSLHRRVVELPGPGADQPGVGAPLQRGGQPDGRPGAGQHDRRRQQRADVHRDRGRGRRGVPRRVGGVRARDPREQRRPRTALRGRRQPVRTRVPGQHDGNEQPRLPDRDFRRRRQLHRRRGSASATASSASATTRRAPRSAASSQSSTTTTTRARTASPRRRTAGS
jgi:hypothetical protein